MDIETVTQNFWTRNKLMFKGIGIGILVLLLQIPAMFVRELIQERESRQQEAITEVSSKWAGRQSIAGPMVVLPYWDTDSTRAKHKHYAYFLPDELNIQATVTPQERYRGIYKVTLYTANINVSGSFGGVDPAKLNIPANNILWNAVFIKFPVNDAKGLNNELIVDWNHKKLNLSSQPLDDRPDNALYAPLEIRGPEDIKQISFSSAIDLSGSEQLLFVPTGRTTTVQLTSPWKNPSFTGDILPQTSQINDNGFTAYWKSLGFKRTFPQQWIDNAYSLSRTNATDEEQTTAAHSNTDESAISLTNIGNAAFGVNLFIPVNNYQKTTRSVKYSMLCILLTFAAFFIIEATNKKSVHTFHYGLVGLALILFYTLLLSFSEYMGFNLSYAIASIFTIGLVSWFVKGLLASGRLAAVLMTVLLLVYGYVFTIMQLQDFALLLGSIGLFVTLGVIMFYSKRMMIVNSQ